MASKPKRKRPHVVSTRLKPEERRIVKWAADRRSRFVGEAAVRAAQEEIVRSGRGRDSEPESGRQ